MKRIVIVVTLCLMLICPSVALAHPTQGRHFHRGQSIWLLGLENGYRIWVIILFGRLIDRGPVVLPAPNP